MEFTHIDANGNAVMVDVSEKQATQRTAVAAGAHRDEPGLLCRRAKRHGEKRATYSAWRRSRASWRPSTPPTSSRCATG